MPPTMMKPPLRQCVECRIVWLAKALKHGGGLGKIKARLMKVRFYRQRPTGSEEIGAIVLREGILVAEPPDSIALNNVLAEPVWLPEGDGWRFIYPAIQPEEFLKALPIEYHGTYFWAGKVED